MRKRITPFPFTRADEDLIKVLLIIGKESWGLHRVEINNIDYTVQRNSLKERIVAHLISEQDGHCAYCSSEPSDFREIDHFFRKKIYPNLTWNANNLLSSCLNCNHRRKGNKNFVINPPSIDERDWIIDATQLQSNVVNPLLDDPLDHIAWSGNFILCLNHLTDIGENTISIFQIDENYATLARSAMHNRDNNPLSEEEEEQLTQIASMPRVRN